MIVLDCFKQSNSWLLYSIVIYGRLLPMNEEQPQNKPNKKNVQIDEDLHAQLLEVKEESGVPITVTVTKAIKNYLKQLRGKGQE